MKKIKTRAGIVFILLVLIAGVSFVLDFTQSESRGLKFYNLALTDYKKQSYADSMKLFAKVPNASALKVAAIFREARCATLLKDNEVAKRKYRYITKFYSNSSISALSLYNLGVLLYEEQDVRAESCFKTILKKYSESQYANSAQYYLAQINLMKVEHVSEAKSEKLISQAIQRLYFYLEKEPNGKFSKMALETLVKLNAIRSPYDNYIVAKSFLERAEYENAKVYMSKTSLSENWDDWAYLAYKLNDKESAKKYIEEGLNNNSEKLENDELYMICVMVETRISEVALFC